MVDFLALYKFVHVLWNGRANFGAVNAILFQNELILYGTSVENKLNNPNGVCTLEYVAANRVSICNN